MPPRRPPAGSRSRLEAYRGKRDFSRTPEPAEDGPGKPGRAFVIHEHHARSHHFDLRLEMHGVLASWAVPKGVPERVGEKRLAVRVEDHPLEYGNFEGEIPKGNYGAGQVAIWDRGTWQPLDKDWKRRLEKGKLKFQLRGGRLDGSWVLARMDEEPNWLLRRIQGSAAGTGSDVGGREKAGFIEPQLARTVASVPRGKEWRHELKYDGYRMIAVRTGDGTRLFTRSGLDWTDKFRELAADLDGLPGGEFVIDGEAVVFDGKGRSRFGLLQEALKGGRGGIEFVVFDLLHLDGRNLRDLPLEERQRRLGGWIPEGSPRLRVSKSWSGDEGPSLFRESCRLGLEGIISKPADGRYLPGQRRAWVKSKCRPRQEFVVCGFTAPGGSRSGFGALVLGSYENGRLVARGKVGSGFTADTRGRLLEQLEPLATERKHFPDIKDVSWVEPQLVVEVEFTELTASGSVRQASFVGLREDKEAAQVRLEGPDRGAEAGERPEVAGQVISHPNRTVFPGEGITKLEVARYYERVAEWMLPHVIDRPLALLRAPDGITGQTFFQKSFKNGVPAHVNQRALEDGTELIVIRDVEGLVSLVQHGTLEFHPWLGSVDRPDRPDQVIWDLDPHRSVPWEETLGTAFLLRDFLEKHGLHPVAKLSGGKGVHVILPIARTQPWAVVKSYARKVAAEVAAMNPRKLTTVSSLSKREGKIYLDWLRNGRGATCVAPWSLRAREGATVAAPVSWDDLADLGPADFDLRSALEFPGEWQALPSQTLPVSLLREMGAL
ncbi:DNA ligase D [Haloferula sargassicola]|uniref:DNA ligase (ATP) n=1 Tax=Haloferula sargassicola TaxID=490096 RepID=A0ABP9UPF5_9BACT